MADSAPVLFGGFFGGGAKPADGSPDAWLPARTRTGNRPDRARPSLHLGGQPSPRQLARSRFLENLAQTGDPLLLPWTLVFRPLGLERGGRRRVLEGALRHRPAAPWEECGPGGAAAAAVSSRRAPEGMGETALLRLIFRGCRAVKRLRGGRLDRASSPLYSPASHRRTGSGIRSRRGFCGVT